MSTSQIERNKDILIVKLMKELKAAKVSIQHIKKESNEFDESYAIATKAIKRIKKFNENIKIGKF